MKALTWDRLRLSFVLNVRADNMPEEPEQVINGEVEEDEPKIPWHFWLCVVLFALYLVYRFVQILIRIVT